MATIYQIGGGGMKRIDVPADHAKNFLPVGTVLKLHGYCDPEYVIIEKLRDDVGGYGAVYEVVNLQSFEISRRDTVGMNHIKDREQHLGIHMFYTDEVLEADQVAAIYNYAKQVAIRTKQAAEKAAQARNEALTALPGKYPHLETLDGSRRSSHSLGARNLKADLKKAFPRTKFSVKSSTYSGGDSIGVSWTDGPLTKDVDAIADNYQEGNFNGMDDSYTYNRSIFPQTFGGAKYVMSQRSVSGESIKLVAERMGFTVELDKWDCISNFDHEKSQMIMREVRATDFRKAAS